MAHRNVKDCKNCLEFEERLSIILESSDVNADDLRAKHRAIDEARRSVCVGCIGERGLGLFDAR